MTSGAPEGSPIRVGAVGLDHRGASLARMRGAELRWISHGAEASAAVPEPPSRAAAI